MAEITNMKDGKSQLEIGKMTDAFYSIEPTSLTECTLFGCPL